MTDPCSGLLPGLGLCAKWAVLLGDGVTYPIGRQHLRLCLCHTGRGHGLHRRVVRGHARDKRQMKGTYVITALCCHIPPSLPDPTLALPCPALTHRCLTLEYGVSSAAVARNWGDKFSVYLESCGWTWLPFGESSNINIWAGVLELICVLIMLVGLNVSQMAVNVFTVAKLILVGFMTLGGFGFFKRSNLKPFAPSGMKGILRGAMRTFFGYLGYDEVCCLGAEAKDPHRNVGKGGSEGGDRGHHR